MSFIECKKYRQCQYLNKSPVSRGHHDILIYLLLCSFALSLDERLAKNGTSLPVPILGKANELVSTVRKQLVVYMDALEERIEVIVGITKIVQFINISAVQRSIYFVFRTTIRKCSKGCPIYQTMIGYGPVL